MSDLDAPATKRDILELRHDLEVLKLATRADLAELKADLKSEMLKMVGVHVGALVALTGIFAVIVNWLVQ